MTEQQINELAEKRYGNEIHSFGQQREGYVEGYKAALNQLADQWIDVRGRLPIKGKLVLFNVEPCDDPYIGMLHHGQFEVWGLGRREPITNMKVTHWQPLPEPPKSKSEP